MQALHVEGYFNAERDEVVRVYTYPDFFLITRTSIVTLYLVGYAFVPAFPKREVV